MPGRETDGFSVCGKCGSLFLNFCLICEKAGLAERVWEIMGRHNLKEDNLIKMLADHIAEGSFPALNLAITMRDMKPSVKSETTIIPGGEISEAKDRIASLLARLVLGSKREEKVERE